MGLFGLFDNRADELCKASRNGAIALVKKLLEGGVNANKYGNDGKSSYKKLPISCAIENGNLNVVQLLLDYGADLDEGRPLYIAAAEGNIEICKLLLERGAFVDGTYDTYDGSGKSAEKFMRTPLSIAATHGYESIVKLLLNNGANIEGLKNNKLETPLAQALLYCDNSTTVAKIFVEHGVSLNLHLCAGLGDLSKMYEFITNGTSPNKLEYDSFGAGYSPLYFAVNCNKLEAVNLLLENGVNPRESIFSYPNKKKHGEGDGVLALAIFKHGNLEMIKILIEKGADITQKVSYGKSLKEFAVMHNRHDVVNFLKNRI
ncbi:ankyrin repeat domain-containing protein [Sulfurospirillum sp. MES]|uniref:ankyrin repeat domain-containing protein n=1 Tax=Sulfurospirillum sp. MES TaxID=1565314 RepID=UPI000543656A|nr:ankyrin repeat domain-containing protein [Sulfurospirillum sp. MES]KHG34819.1 MAG: hypothetical protein OA34_01245 [Sulfurospirillum sp. MES]